MKEYYKQCQLKKGNVHTTAWIPERGAKVGYVVELKDLKEFWEVISVGIIRKEYSEIKERERDYVHQRKASDI